MFCVVGTLDAQPARQVASRNLPNVLFIAVDDLNEWHGTNHAIRSEKYHYIRYDDGGEELYDMSRDPHLAASLAHAEIKQRLKAWLPKTSAPHFGGFEQ